MKDGYNLKNIKQKFKEKGIYYTPPELIDLMKSYIDVKFNNVYDPTCGDGGLLRTFPDAIDKYGQEINKDQLEVAKETVVNFRSYLGDTLVNPGFKNKKFDLIMANPPFGIKWIPQTDERFNVLPTIPTQGRADYAFLAHIIHYLSEEGQAIVLQFPGILYRRNREYEIRKWFVEKNYIEKIILIPGDTFVDTKIETVLLVLKKNKTTTDIVFEEKRLKEKKVISLQEIKDNDYDLSVNHYITEKIEKVEQDPIKLQKHSREYMIKKLKGDIDVDMLICELEEFDKEEYLNMLAEVLEQKKKQYLRSKE